MGEGLSTGRRVGFFGGSFDPPHLGHLAVARAARDALRLDRVLFAPVGAQPLKPNGSTAAFDDRVAMTELAIAGEPRFEISLADAPQAAGMPNYTLETLRKLRNGMPEESTLFCLLGADSFLGLRHWRSGAEIPFVAPLIVASRPGQRLDDLTAALPEGLTVEEERAEDTFGKDREADPEREIRSYRLRNRAQETTPFYLLPGLQVEISASAIRQQVRSTAGASALDVLPAAVADYIRARNLYQ